LAFARSDDLGKALLRYRSFADLRKSDLLCDARYIRDGINAPLAIRDGRNNSKMLPGCYTNGLCGEDERLYNLKYYPEMIGLRRSR
jgi:hypothetical protein